jgi:hypothetical protein
MADSMVWQIFRPSKSSASSLTRITPRRASRCPTSFSVRVLQLSRMWPSFRLRIRSTLGSPGTYSRCFKTHRWRIQSKWTTWTWQVFRLALWSQIRLCQFSIRQWLWHQAYHLAVFLPTRLNYCGSLRNKLDRHPRLSRTKRQPNQPALLLCIITPP